METKHPIQSIDFDNYYEYNYQNHSNLMLFIIRQILTGVRNMNKKIRDIVETNGDSTWKVPIKSSDEIGEIVENYNRLKFLV